MARTMNHSTDTSPTGRKPAQRPVRPARSRPPELREVRVSLAKGLLETLSGFEGIDTGQEHVANRPNLALALVQDALVARASDIHLEPRESELRVRFRIDGGVSDVARLTGDQGRWLTNQFKALASLDPVARFTPTDCHARLSVQDRTIDLRLAVAPCQQGEAVSIRLLNPERLERSLDDLGLTQSNLEQLEDWLENVNGMFLSSGPTGCGKTTTLYALLHKLKFADRIVVSIEDPVEYEISGITQVQLDEKHHLSFAEGVKAMLRLDADFLMIGEIRDAASAQAAVDAAITGRVLLSTVHSRDAVGVITALRNWGLPDHEIAESLAVVVAQRLVRRLCPACRKPAPPTHDDRRWLRAVRLPAPKRAWAATGCQQCHGLGYLGRTGIFELWRLRENDHRLIREHSDEHLLRQHFHQNQPVTLLKDGLEKVEGGVTSFSELRRASSGAFPGDWVGAPSATSARRLRK